MDDLAQWLGQQLDIDGRIARAADAELSNVFTRIASFDPEMADDERHIMEHRPTRVLREIDAKRRLLADVLSEPHFMSADDHWNTCPAIVDVDGVPVCLDESRAPGPRDCGRDARVPRRLRLLALPYAYRPGYLEEWRP